MGEKEESGSREESEGEAGETVKSIADLFRLFLLVTLM